MQRIRKQDIERRAVIEAIEIRLFKDETSYDHPLRLGTGRRPTQLSGMECAHLKVGGPRGFLLWMRSKSDVGTSAKCAATRQDLPGQNRGALVFLNVLASFVGWRPDRKTILVRKA